jgi:hypothetical protein
MHDEDEVEVNDENKEDEILKRHVRNKPKCYK